MALPPGWGRCVMSAAPMTTNQETVEAARELPSTFSRRMLALRHFMPGFGVRVLGRISRFVINRRRRKLGLPSATHAVCARTVRIRGRGRILLTGGYRLENSVELVAGSD